MKTTLIKNNLLIVFSLAISHSIIAQFGLTAGVQTSFIRSSSFNEFKNSYADYLGTQLKSEIKNPSQQLGWTFGADFEIHGFYGFTNFSKSYGEVSIDFSDNSLRNLEFRQFITDIGIGYGKFMDRFAFGMGLGMAFGEDKIMSSFQYTDGTVSYATDKELNGVYDGIHLGWSGHLLFSFGLTDHIHLFTRAQYLFGSITDIGGPIGDLMTHKSQNAVAGENNTGIPTNYELFLQNQGNFTYPDDEYVAKDFGGLRIETGIRLQFGGI